MEIGEKGVMNYWMGGRKLGCKMWMADCVRSSALNELIACHKNYTFKLILFISN